MLRHPQGAYCAVCHIACDDPRQVFNFEPIPAPARAVAPVPRSTADSAAALDVFAVHQRSQGFSETTILNRRSTLDAIEKMAGVPLLELTRPLLVAYLGRDGVKASTRRSNQVALRAFFRFATAEGYRDDDPAADLPTVRVPRGKPRPFSREQIDQLLSSGAYARTRAMILLGYYQGFRVSSIARVHGADIDLQGMRIRTVAKGGKERTSPLHPVIAALAATMPRDDYWFPARRGREGHIDRAGVSDLIRKARDRAGITDPHLTAHSLRHSFATHLVEESVNMRVIQELMMHDSLGSTQVYSGVSEGLAQDGIQRLPGMDLPRRSGRRPRP